MKKCSFCAEEIQDAAIVCKHCRRALAGSDPAAPSSVRPRRSRLFRNIALTIGALAIIGAIRIVVDPESPTRMTQASVLQVSAGKGASRFSMTNREAAALHDCTVRLLDQGSAEWVASMTGPIEPSQTVHVAWSEFRSNGQSMPSYIGQNRGNLIVSCAGAGGTRRSAGVAF